MDRTIGYLPADTAEQWAGVVRRVVASGYIPTTASRIWASEYDGWDGIEFNADVRLAIDTPSTALPMNDPPIAPYAMLPRSGIVQVTKEDEHFDVLMKHVPEDGYGLLFATLHEKVPTTGRAKPHVEVRIDDERIGQLAPQMSQRFLPMIRHLAGRHLTVACWSDITGSSVAAEVRIDAIKANEATVEILDGPPVTVDRLVAGSADPLSYDLTLLQPLLTPLLLVQPSSPPIPAEPPDGSVVRFSRGNGHYTYVAVRRHNQWETTSSGSGGSITELMSWQNLASQVRKFEIATTWAPVAGFGDPRIREHLAVVRFMIGDLYLAAVNIRADGRPEGDWYTTITDHTEKRAPLGSRTDWSEIVKNGQHIQIAAVWAPLT